MKKKPNIFFITIDCLRADFFKSLDGIQLMPNLLKFTEKGTYFSDTYSNGPTTRNSFPSILSSSYTLMYPSFYKKFSEHRLSIHQFLKNKGYSTIGINSNPYLSSYYQYNRDFDIYHDILSKDPLTLESIFRKVVLTLKKTSLKKLTRFTLKDRPYNRAKIMNKIALSSLKKVNKPFFIWLHYMDPHVPYFPPRKFRGIKARKVKYINQKVKNDPSRLSESDIKNFMELYKGTLKYVDEELGNLMHSLEALELTENSLFIITSDHGDEFKEHGGFSHTAKLYDELLHVPLIMKGPNIPEDKVITKMVSLIDIAPTITDYLGYNKPDEFKGMSLIPLLEDHLELYQREHVISELLLEEPFNRLVSIRTKDWKFILNEKNNNKELYDLKTDQEELHNVVDSHEDITVKFEAIIKRHKEMEMQNHIKINTQNIDKITKNIKI